MLLCFAKVTEHNQTVRSHRSRRSRRSERSRRSAMASVTHRNQMDVGNEIRPVVRRKINHQCYICRSSFTSRSALKDHANLHKTNCRWCDRSFQKAIALSRHLQDYCDKIPPAIRRNILIKEFKKLTSKTLRLRKHSSEHCKSVVE